jgi:osmotically-inducible protein OsmY
VSTTNHVVTLRGEVRSAAEHDRAVHLARETAGVSEVVDRLGVAR